MKSNQILEADFSAPDRDNEEMFVRLLAQHDKDIYRYLLSLVFDVSAVDDLMQEVAVALWKKFDEFDHDRPFLPWAFRFAYFQVLKHRTKMGKSRLIFGDKLLESLAADYEGEQDSLVARRRALADCLGKLGTSDRELIELRYNSSETIQNLAKRRKLSAHKLYHSLERIRRLLLVCAQRTLKKEGYEELA